MTVKRNNRSDEDKLCIAFAKHCNVYFPVRAGELVWSHIANQGRSPQQGDKLKKMGVHAGWFDYIFISHPSKWSAIVLEAKVHGRDYSQSQKDFQFFTNGMPIFKDKFYTVEEGHNKLMEAGLIPMQPCRYFVEPNTMSWEDKIKEMKKFYSPL